jgi:membrane-bound lytic murein transglycosylase D
MISTPRIIVYSATAGAIAAGIVLALYSFMSLGNPGKEANDAYLQHISEKYRIYSLPMPDQLDFAGEKVPLDQWDVREKFDRELLVNTYWHSNTLLAIKRAQRWFPVIEPILKQNSIPDDFKYLALIESGLTQTVSPSGATGFWQFLDGTGKEYGLEVNDEVDERYHIEKSTQAACDYLNKAHQEFGSWSMAAASYNMGTGGLGKQTDRQRRSNYWDLLLNEETSRYVFRILAMKEIVNNADKYGFVIRPADLYEPLTFTTVSVDSTVNDFALFAEQLGISYKTLKLYNPWLRQNYLRNKEKKSYSIKLPANK